MDILLYLLPIALTLGLVGLEGFMWSLKHRQYDDLEGAAHRILMEDDIPDDKERDNSMTKPESPPEA